MDGSAGVDRGVRRQRRREARTEEAWRDATKGQRPEASLHACASVRLLSRRADGRTDGRTHPGVKEIIIKIKKPERKLAAVRRGYFDEHCRLCMQVKVHLGSVWQPVDAPAGSIAMQTADTVANGSILAL